MASVLEAVEKTETLLILGGSLLFLYWFMTSDATQALRDKLSGLVPEGVSQLPPPPPGTEKAVGDGKIGNTPDGNTQYHVASSGAITVSINGSMREFGNSAEVGGTGQTVGDLRNSGYSDSDIAMLLDQSQVYQ